MKQTSAQELWFVLKAQQGLKPPMNLYLQLTCYRSKETCKEIEVTEITLLHSVSLLQDGLIVFLTVHHEHFCLGYED